MPVSDGSTPTDIALNDSSIEIEAEQALNVHALDLRLDSPYRRQNSDGTRRALVHDIGDGLTLNYAGDYPNGVKIEGDTFVSGDLTVGTSNVRPGTIQASNLVLETPEGTLWVPTILHNTNSVIPAAGHIRAAKIELLVDSGRWTGADPGEVMVPIKAPADLGDMINELRDRIATLESEIATLKASV